MRPNAMANANATVGVGGNGVGASSNANATSTSNGVNIPINHEYGHPPPPQQQAGYYVDPSNTAYGSPRQQQQQQIPAHFQQGFDFEPGMHMDMERDMDMDMFPRSRIGRMHDPFSNFGSSHFGFPQFSTMGRRRANDAHDDDFFQRLPSQFRQYIPETFGHRRQAGTQPQQQPQSTNQGGQYFHYPSSASNPSMGSNTGNTAVPPSPTKKVCDAAIQTEDLAAADTVDSGSIPRGDNLQQHGLRNTVDMGIKSALESDAHGARSHSAPPNEQPQQQPQSQQQQAPMNGRRQTPPPQAQFGTQTSSHGLSDAGQQPQFQKSYYAPQHQPHPQQQRSQQPASPPPPQTPGGTFVRTIPIFVEGRDEPIINSHKEIPMQSGAPSASASARAHVPHPPNQQQQHYYQQQQPPHPQQHQQRAQQQHRPTPLNTHQAPQQRTASGEQQPQRQQPGSDVPPQTPHTLDSINKIQDIQRDVLELMAQVENFTGTRKDKRYAYLDEMLTRNLLKLDTIDTQGKESIRQARKEAIKCIQASINVLEAKAEENARKSSGDQARPAAASSIYSEETAQMSSGEEAATTSASELGHNTSDLDTAEPSINPQEPIPLPPPEGMQVDDGTQVSHSNSETSENITSNVSQTNTESSPMDTNSVRTDRNNAESNENCSNSTLESSDEANTNVNKMDMK